MHFTLTMLSIISEFYSCFRRLLLEFVKAFAHLVGEWKEEE